MLWFGLRAQVNRLRKSLGLSKFHYRQFKATRQVPHSFLYSKYLLPRPSDWGQHVRIVGAARLTATQTQGEPSYEPSDELERFLSQGERRPIFIGFGSMILPSPKRFCDDVVRAATAANTNVLLQAGWSNFNDCKPNENVFIMGPAPHAWLFPRVSAVVHHGGAGTTASGLYAGKPTMIVPFFGGTWTSTVLKNFTVDFDFPTGRSISMGRCCGESKGRHCSS